MQYFLLQYNTIRFKKTSIYCTLQYIVIYCNTYIAMFVVFKVLNVQLLHCKSDWTSCNLEYTVQFLTILDGYSFLLLLKNHISMWNVLVPKSSHIAILQYIAIHSNAIHNTALTHSVSPLMYVTLMLWVLNLDLMAFVMYIVVVYRKSVKIHC